ncbi:DNA internalization-related competence protein ComEC/Rec2 [Chitinivorax sp. PXF-14]|uniref:DNA internalization-related competence protein ComEC/Rec2 n=1 Tax=Chitinivorax sp. PXF-14 TaxID=3230488 RepID=UPI0034656C58
MAPHRHLPLSLIAGFVFGDWLLQQQAGLPSPWVGLALLPFTLIVCMLPAPAKRLGQLVIAVGIGFCWANAWANWRMADELPHEWEMRDVAIAVVIRELPVDGDHSTRLVVDVDEVLTPGAHIPSRLQLTRFGGEAERFQPGERWHLVVRLKRPHGQANPFNFDYEGWLLQQGIRATGSIRQAQRLNGTSFAPIHLVNRLRAAIRERMLATLGTREYSGVVVALAIGDQQAIPAEQWQLFARTGITHAVSVSGLHITLVASLAGAIGAWLSRTARMSSTGWPPRKVAIVVGGVAALGYVVLSGWSLPAQRTLYMLAIASIALWRGRPVAVSRILALALGACVVLDPWAVLAPGFWLSFGAVGLILWVSTNRLGTPHWLPVWGRVQWAVTLGLAPALLLYFQQLPLLSPVANALAIPLIGSIVTPLSLLGCVFTPLLIPTHALLAFGMAGLQLLADLPHALWAQPAAPAWATLFALLGVVWWLAPAGLPGRPLGGLMLLPLFLVAPDTPQRDVLRVVFIDVGQGLAVLVQTARHSLLYDAGPSLGPDTDAGVRNILPYLRGSGIGTLGGLVVSHNDADHSGGAASLMAAMPVGWLLSSLPPGHPLTARGVRPIACVTGQHWAWDGIRFTMLSPSPALLAQAGIKDNAKSCVLRIDSPHGSVLLTGDLERDGEWDLLDGQAQLAADILSVPHHGSATSSSSRFIAAVAPRYAVISAGYLNRFGHPKPAIVERYRDAGSRILRTDEDGALQFDLSPAGIEVHAYRSPSRHYWWDAP